jgi:perosamine synthetase
VTALSLFNVVKTDAAIDAVANVIRSGQIASGAYVQDFQVALGTLVGNPHVTTTDNMSSALMIALRLAGAGPGCEVIASPFACLSTNSPIAASGAKAVWADIDPSTGMLTAQTVEPLITAHTKAILLYHLAGYPGPAEELAALAKRHGIALIEDCDNALGATQDSKPLGLAGDYAVWSFYPNRQINTMEGGALACASAEQHARAQKLKRFGIHGPSFRDRLGEIDPAADVPEIGWSVSMSNAASAMGLTQIDSLPERLARTRANAQTLSQLVADFPGVTALQVRANANPAYWGYMVRVPRRDAVLVVLKKQGVMASKLHHRNDDYSGFGATRRALPGVDQFMAEVLALPCGWWLETRDMHTIADQLRSALDASR